MSDFEWDAGSGQSGRGWSADMTQRIRSCDYINSVHVYIIHVTVMGTPAGEKERKSKARIGSLTMSLSAVEE